MQNLTSVFSQKLHINRKDVEYMPHKPDCTRYQHCLCNEIDALIDLKDKYKKFCLTYLSGISINKIAFLFIKKAMKCLRYVATPLFISLILYYYKDVNLNKSNDPLIDSGLISLEYDPINIQDLDSVYDINERYSSHLVPCNRLEYTIECPMIDGSHTAKVHRSIAYIGIFAYEVPSYQNFSKKFNDNNMCLLPMDTPIFDDHSLPLQRVYDISQLIEEFLWYIVIGVTASATLLRKVLDRYYQSDQIPRCISHWEIDAPLLFLKKYVHSQETDEEYARLILLALLARVNFSIAVEYSLKETSTYFCENKDSLQIKKHPKRDLEIHIAKEKRKIAKLLALQPIFAITPHGSSPNTRLFLIAGIVFLDIAISTMCCHPYGRIGIFVMHLLYLSTFPQEKFDDDSLVNTLAKFSDISSIYSIIDKLPEPTQKDLLERLAIESIYSSDFPLRKSSVMEKVIKVVNHLYNGSRLTSLLSILDNNSHRDYIKRTSVKVLK